MITFMFKDTIVITNRKLVKGDYLEQIKKVVSLHPYALILREKDLTYNEYEELSLKVFEICNKEKVTCYIHTRYEIARKIACKNIHLSISSLIDNKDSIKEFENISVTCHSLGDVKKALENGASQIILGTIFETECKKGLRGAGLGFVKEITAYCKSQGNVPVFAIGGISPDNIDQVKHAGARGGCMMSYMMTLN